MDALFSERELSCCLFKRRLNIEEEEELFLALQGIVSILKHLTRA